MDRIRHAPPIQAGALKGLSGVPVPSCHCHILGLSDHLGLGEVRQEERILERKVEKIVRRLLLKAGFLLLSVKESIDTSLFFQIDIFVWMTAKYEISSSVHIEFIQEVFLMRDPGIRIEAVTWNYGPEKISRRYDLDEEDLLSDEKYPLSEIIWWCTIREGIRNGVRHFVRAYHADKTSNGRYYVPSGRNYDPNP